MKQDVEFVLCRWGKVDSHGDLYTRDCCVSAAKVSLEGKFITRYELVDESPTTGFVRAWARVTLPEEES